jgi:hypothetical protein
MKYSDTDLQQLAAVLGGTSDEARHLISMAQSEKERRAAAALQADPEAGRLNESEYAALRMQAETLGVPFDEYLREMAIMRSFTSLITEERPKRAKLRLPNVVESVGERLPRIPF